MPRLLRDAAQTPIATRLKAFLADLGAKGRAKNTLSKYRNTIPALCKRCGWVVVRDGNAQSFTLWRGKTTLRAKMLNDLLAARAGFLHWMERQQLIRENPLKHVERVRNRSPREFRRALLPKDAQRVLNVSPPHRAIVSQTIRYTGLRSSEMKGLRWADFELEATPPCVRVPSSISKNRNPSEHKLAPTLWRISKRSDRQTRCPTNGRSAALCRGCRRSRKISRRRESRSSMCAAGVWTSRPAEIFRH